MPYIKNEQRHNLEYLLRPIMNGMYDNTIQSVGDLNYIITHIIHNFIEKNGMNYTNLNSVIGLLECVKQEYYRRIVTQYETIKIEENGDIYQRDRDNNYITKM